MTPLTEQKLKAAEVNLKSVLSKRSDQGNGEEGSDSSKIEQRVIQWHSIPKRGQFHKKRKTRKQRCTSSSSQSRSSSRRKKKWSKKQSKKRWRRRSSGLSMSSASSHSSSSVSEKEDQETKRFHIVSNEDQFKWDLPTELASFASTEFEKYIPDESYYNAICELH